MMIIKQLLTAPLSFEVLVDTHAVVGPLIRWT